MVDWSSFHTIFPNGPAALVTVLSLSPSSFFLFLSIKMLLTFYNKLNINSTDNDCMIVIAGHDRKRLVQWGETETWWKINYVYASVSVSFTIKLQLMGKCTQHVRLSVNLPFKCAWFLLSTSLSCCFSFAFSDRVWAASFW